jgi:hypothetical protein
MSEYSRTLESYRVLSGSRVYLRLIKSEDATDEYMQSIALVEGLTPHDSLRIAESGFTGSLLQHSGAS